jgi:hypothetical protein
VIRAGWLLNRTTLRQDNVPCNADSCLGALEEPKIQMAFFVRIGHSHDDVVFITAATLATDCSAKAMRGTTSSNNIS